jgi:hypothetical protein
MRYDGHGYPIARTLIAAGCLTLLIATVGAQGPPIPPAPPSPLPSPLPGANSRCDATIGGLVYRRVGENEEAGLRSIQVQLLDENGARIAEVRTNREGIFAFRNLCVGTYTVCPGTPCPANGPVPSRFVPPSATMDVGPRLQRVEFRRLPPPPLADVNDPERR